MLSEEGKTGVIYEVEGKKFRFGFENAFWSGLNDPSYSEASRLIIARRENVLSSTATIYHYTSLHGFQGIINESGFWASDNRFMNDAQEIKNGNEFIIRVLQHCKRKSRCYQFEKILEKILENIVIPNRVGNFVACFSTVRDSLEQWRGYGAEGAVCIGLTNHLPGARPLFFGPDALQHKAFYDTRAKIILLLSIIRRFEKEYDLDRQTMSDIWPSNHDDLYTERLTSMLIWRTIAFKDFSFKQESETRMVIPYETADNYYEGGTRFRVSPLGLIPYICTGSHKDLSGPLPITEVVVGPSPRQELIGASIRTFLDAKGYNAAVVRMSSVPYRSG
ncbi:MAG: hypothetical protein POG74_08370 [Acidocella sp.]|nr:hypothetical protein [Acidocella sp.]